MKQYRYKLTSQDMTTYHDTHWVVGEWKEASGIGELCTKGWYHCYCDPLLAILHNPVHTRVLNPRLWIVEVSGKQKRDGMMKEGWTRMRLVEELEIPEITLVQTVAYGILCALSVYKEDGFVQWAESWLDGSDRSTERAARAARAERAASAASAARAAWAVSAECSTLNLMLLASKAMMYK